MRIGERLLPKIKDIEVEKIGDLVDKELQQTTDAIEQAAKRFQVRLAQKTLVSCMSTLITVIPSVQDCL